MYESKAVEQQQQQSKMNVVLQQSILLWDAGRYSELVHGPLKWLI